MSWQDFVEKLPTQTIPAGSQIFYQGDHCNQYFVLVSGTARIFTRSANGKEVLLYRIESGEFCVLTTACLLGQQDFPAEAIAETDLTVHVMQKKQFDHLINESTEFRDYVFSGFGRRINSLIKTIEKLTLEPIEQRVAKFLLQQPSNIITLTHSQIATEIGSAREVVSRHLKRFEKNHWLQLGRSSIELIDREALHHLT